MCLKRPNFSKDKDLEWIGKKTNYTIYIYQKDNMKFIWQSFLSFWFPSEFQWGQLSGYAFHLQKKKKKKGVRTVFPLKYLNFSILFLGK